MKIKLFIMMAIISICQLTCTAQQIGSFTDKRDGKIYKTVKIGNQIWMAENFAYKATKGCWSYNANPANVKIYGYLYDFESANSSCPNGWHLPSDDEWTILENSAGENPGSQLMAILGWLDSNNKVCKGFNSLGFNAKPAGRGCASDGYYGIGHDADWWTSSDSGRCRGVSCSLYSIGGSNNSKGEGHSVRYVKDKK